MFVDCDIKVALYRVLLVSRYDPQGDHHPESDRAGQFPGDLCPENVQQVIEPVKSSRVSWNHLPLSDIWLQFEVCGFCTAWL